MSVPLDPLISQSTGSDEFKIGEIENEGIPFVLLLGIIQEVEESVVPGSCVRMWTVRIPPAASSCISLSKDPSGGDSKI